jgi:cold-inducible RNA-binding protein
MAIAISQLAAFEAGQSSIDPFIADLKPERRDHPGKSNGLRRQQMSTKLYIGNLPSDITEEDLRNMLAPHGPVNEIAVVMDKMTGRPRGFAFATMNTPEGVTGAIQALNGKDWKGRPLTVNEARPREEGARGGGGYRGGGDRPRY